MIVNPSMRHMARRSRWPALFKSNSPRLHTAIHTRGVNIVGDRLSSTQSTWTRSNDKIALEGSAQEPSLPSYVPRIRKITNQDTKVSGISRSLPFLNQSYRPNLTCSLAPLLEDNGVNNLLWGDILHYIHGGEQSLPHEYSFVIENDDLLEAHDILQQAGFKRCNLRSCYLNYRYLGAPAGHYHIDRPPASWPEFSEFRGQDIPNDLNPDFEELETIRLYLLKDTLWELKSLQPGQEAWRSPGHDIQDAGSLARENPRWEDRWPSCWPVVRIPTAQRYTEALILHWVRYKDTKKEMFWFFKLFDICGTFYDFHGCHILSRMERHCRHVMQALLDHIDDREDVEYHSGTLNRDILLHAERTLRKRATGPLRHDPNDREYDQRRLMPPRFPTGRPYGWCTEDLMLGREKLSETELEAMEKERIEMEKALYPSSAGEREGC